MSTKNPFVILPLAYNKESTRALEKLGISIEDEEFELIDTKINISKLLAYFEEEDGFTTLMFDSISFKVKVSEEVIDNYIEQYYS